MKESPAESGDKKKQAPGQGKEEPEKPSPPALKNLEDAAERELAQWQQKQEQGKNRQDKTGKQKPAQNSGNQEQTKKRPPPKSIFRAKPWMRLK